jgi:cobalamin synthase
MVAAYKFLSRNGTLLAFAAVVVLFVVALIPILSGYSAFSSIPTERQAFSEEGSIFTLGLIISIGLLILGTVLAIVLSLLQIVSNPKAAMKGIIAFGIIIVLFFIFYSMADSNIGGSLGKTIDDFKISSFIFGLVSGGIQLSILMLVGSVIIAILMEIWNYFKNQ